MAAVSGEEILDRVTAFAQRTKLFETVAKHEPRSAPRSLPAIAFFIGAPQGAPGGFKIVPRLSGLATAGMRLDVICRIYVDAKKEPLDKIDADLLAYIEAIMRGCHAQISLGIPDQGVWTDANGADSDGLSAVLAYLDQDNMKFRIAEIYIPVIITDYFPQTI